MTTPTNCPLIQDLSTFFRSKSGINAMILTGSHAEETIQVDEWSDVDITLIVEDESVATYFITADWLHQLGQVIGLERHDAPEAKTLRACLLPFERLDVTFIPESTLAHNQPPARTRVTKPFRILWSDITITDNIITRLFSFPEFIPVAHGTFQTMDEAFGFKAALAITKVMRNDLLIAQHLALDLARDCLVLQMHNRDRKCGTNIHRKGGFGNKLVRELLVADAPNTHLVVLNFIEQCLQAYDDVRISTLSGHGTNEYDPKYPHFAPTIELAKLTL